MTASPWEPGQDNPDRADDVHDLLDVIPEHLRTAGAMLLDLPGYHPVPQPGSPGGTVPAGRMFVWLCTGQITPDQVCQRLLVLGMVRPGLGGAS